MFAPLNSNKDSKDLNQNSEKKYIFILIDFIIIILKWIKYYHNPLKPNESYVCL